MLAMPLSHWFLFRRCLIGTQRPGPHLIEVGPQSRHTLWIQLVQTPRSSLADAHQACILQHPQMLRYRGTAHRQRARQLIYGDGAARKPLENRHARGITQGVDAAL